MDNEEKTTIDMGTIEQPEEPKAQEPESGKPDGTTVAEPEKPVGLGTRIWRTVTAPGRWIKKTIKESPAAAGLGMVGGAALALAGKALLGFFQQKSGADGFLPAETPEIEIPDDGEIYVHDGMSDKTD